MLQLAALAGGDRMQLNQSKRRLAEENTRVARLRLCRNDHFPFGFARCGHSRAETGANASLF